MKLKLFPLFLKNSIDYFHFVLYNIVQTIKTISVNGAKMILKKDTREPLHKQLRKSILREISENHELGSRIPPELDFAKKYKVNRGTVRRALDSLVKDGILERHRPKGTFVAKCPLSESADEKKISNIGVLFPSYAKNISVSPFYGEVFEGMLETAPNDNFSVFPINETVFSRDEFQKRITTASIDGFILLSDFSDGFIANFADFGKPYVLGDCPYEGGDVDSIASNNVEGAMLAVQHLTDLGHEKIAMIGGPGFDHSSKQRLRGYKLALLENGIDFKKNLLVHSKELNQQSGKKACQELLKRKNNFTALFAVNDAVAMGIYEALAETEIKIPEQVSIVGFDDISTASIMHPSLTTVRVEKKALATNIVKQVQLKMGRYYSPPVKIRISNKLITRNSTQNKER